MKLFILPLLLSLLCHVQCSPTYGAVHEERAACNKDNLLNALINHSAEATTFCSAYISVPSVTTQTLFVGTCTLSTYKAVLSTIHPLQLYNLQPITTSATPLIYNSVSPSPSTIPGGAQSYGWPRKRDDSVRVDAPPEPIITPSPSISQQELLRRASNPPLPPWLATTYPPSRISSGCSCLSVPAAFTTTIRLNDYTQVTTTTCGIYTPTTVATYPAVCAPSLQANAPNPLSHANWSVVAPFPVANKMDCCAACSNVFNCVWWKFNFGTPGKGWSPGTCHYAYFTGPKGDALGGQPAICPNGVTQGISQDWHIKIGRESNNNEPGYNFGPCGNAFNIFQSSQDGGYPDFDDGISCNNINPPEYVGQCGAPQ